MERWQNRVAVVTGGGSGIGEAIAKDLVKAGLRVVPLGRRRDLLDKNRSNLPIELQDCFFPQTCDVSKEEEVNKTFDWIEENLGGTDILVNNAGINRLGNLLDLKSSEINQVIETNVKGLIHCTRAAYRSMKARNFDGHIIHINSIAGHKVPDMGQNVSLNVYPATKYAVTAINETLRLELLNLGTRIKTTSISPGLVKTEILSEGDIKRFGEFALNPEDISQAVLFAISTPPHVQIHEMTVKPLGERP